jgi:hypothetical protein
VLEQLQAVLLDELGQAERTAAPATRQGPRRQGL